MAAAHKLVAVFFMCMVVLAAVHIEKTEANEEQFRECYNTCHKECSAAGNGYTFCEMKCDTDCGVKEVKAKLDKF